MTIDQFTKEIREAEQADGYYVTTWDADLQKFTPQRGVNDGPYSLFGLRKPLRRLRQMGYEIDRAGAYSVLVKRRGPPIPRDGFGSSCHCPASCPIGDCTEAGVAGSGVFD